MKEPGRRNWRDYFAVSAFVLHCRYVKPTRTRNSPATRAKRDLLMHVANSTMTVSTNSGVLFLNTSTEASTQRVIIATVGSLLLNRVLFFGSYYFELKPIFTAVIYYWIFLALLFIRSLCIPSLN